MDSSILSSENLCTGCGACTTVCPTKAISYQINDNGFYTSLVNENKCIKCGKCKKVCIKFLKPEQIGKSLNHGILYSAQTLDRNTLKTCTSGGVAYELAKYGIKNDYIVTGVVYDYELNIAKTVIVEENELEQTKGSKYIQALTGDCFNQIIEMAKSDPDSKFMIFGTPCQILGIENSFIVNNLKNKLITIDLFCHGVPSYLVWQGYLKWLNEKNNIDKFNSIVFRSKINGWHDFTMHIDARNVKYEKSSEYDLFYRIFFDNILLNLACSDCIVRKERSVADIRLGDLWGKKYQDNRDGVSAVLCLSSTGEDIIKKLKTEGYLRIIEKENIAECLNNQSTHNYDIKNIHNEAIQTLRNGLSLKKVIKKYRKNFSFRRKIKINMKEVTAYFPSIIRKKLRNWYRKRV